MADLHRRIGSAGVALAAVMMVAAFAVTLDLGRRGAAPPGVPPLTFLIVPFSTLIVFPVLIGSAFAWRRTPETHKRRMLIGTRELVPAGFGRWPMHGPYGPLGYFGMTDVFLLAILAYDRITRGRFHPATLWAGGFLVASQILRVLIGGTERGRRLHAGSSARARFGLLDRRPDEPGRSLRAVRVLYPAGALHAA